MLKLEIEKAQHYEQIHNHELHLVFEYSIGTFIKNKKSDGWRRSNYKRRSRTFLVYLFNRFACVSYGRFMAIRYRFRLSMYVQESLLISRRGCVQTEI